MIEGSCSFGLIGNIARLSYSIAIGRHSCSFDRRLQLIGCIIVQAHHLHQSFCQLAQASKVAGKAEPNPLHF
jgi:hypothetical protein